MKPIEITVSRIPPPFPSWAHALTVWPFIFYEPHVRDDPCVQAHERYHWQEQRRWFGLPWLLAYLLLGLFYIGKPADRHPMEREAYRLERECRRRSA